MKLIKILLVLIVISYTVSAQTDKNEFNEIKVNTISSLTTENVQLNDSIDILPSIWGINKNGMNIGFAEYSNWNQIKAETEQNGTSAGIYIESSNSGSKIKNYLTSDTEGHNWIHQNLRYFVIEMYDKINGDGSWFDMTTQYIDFYINGNILTLRPDKIIAYQDLQLKNNLEMYSPNGTCYKVTINDNGTLSSEGC